VINARELRRQAGFPGPKGAKELDAALELLVDAGWLARNPGEGGSHARISQSTQRSTTDDDSLPKLSNLPKDRMQSRRQEF
jgi:hypothetical protein